MTAQQKETTSLFHQLDAAERECVALVIGATDSDGFRNLLRDTPAIAVPFNLGDAAYAYLVARLAEAEKRRSVRTQT